MDTLASSSQLPSPAESTDIFSLTDQVLSDRLEFIEEVRLLVTLLMNHELNLSCRLALETGAASGSADPNLRQQRTVSLSL